MNCFTSPIDPQQQQELQPVPEEMLEVVICGSSDACLPFNNAAASV
jgi:hypothetical protein